MEKSDAGGEGAMEISCLTDGWSCSHRGSRMDPRFAWKSLARRLGCAVLAVSLRGVAITQSAPLVLERDGRVISLEPYAANIVRVTMSIDKAGASGAPGYGFVAKPSVGQWTHERDAEGGDVFFCYWRSALGDPISRPICKDLAARRGFRSARAFHRCRQPFGPPWRAWWAHRL
jgi:hypothetical protein